MSNQGNVIFVPKAGTNRPKLFIQTGRWGGSLMHRQVAEVLTDPRGQLYDQDEVLSGLLSPELGWLPIAEIGNEDVPTIILDFDEQTVTIARVTNGGRNRNIFETLETVAMEDFQALLGRFDESYE